jgi:hypothetical protein
MKLRHCLYSDPEFDQECQHLQDAGYEPMLCATHHAHKALSAFWHALLATIPGMTVDDCADDSEENERMRDGL